MVHEQHIYRPSEEIADAIFPTPLIAYMMLVAFNVLFLAITEFKTHEIGSIVSFVFFALVGFWYRIQVRRRERVLMQAWADYYEVQHLPEIDWIQWERLKSLDLPFTLIRVTHCASQYLGDDDYTLHYRLENPEDETLVCLYL